MDHLARHAQEVGRLTAAVEPFTADKASAISGVTPEDLGDFLVAVRKDGRLCSETGTGVNMSRRQPRRLARMGLCDRDTTRLGGTRGQAMCSTRRHVRTGLSHRLSPSARIRPESTLMGENRPVRNATPISELAAHCRCGDDLPAAPLLDGSGLHTT